MAQGLGKNKAVATETEEKTGMVVSHIDNGN